MTGVSDTPVAGLDSRRVGEMLMKLPAISAYLRHESIEGTLEYVHPLPGDREAEFVCDFLTLPSDELLDKWYGGRFCASELAAGVMDSVLQDLVS